MKIVDEILEQVSTYIDPYFIQDKMIGKCSDTMMNQILKSDGAKHNFLLILFDNKLMDLNDLIDNVLWDKFATSNVEKDIQSLLILLTNVGLDSNTVNNLAHQIYFYRNFLEMELDLDIEGSYSDDPLKGVLTTDGTENDISILQTDSVDDVYKFLKDHMNKKNKS